MPITKELLQQRIEEYRKGALQLKADSDANAGAAQALELLLQELEAESSEQAVGEG